MEESRTRTRFTSKINTLHPEKEIVNANEPVQPTLFSFIVHNMYYYPLLKIKAKISVLLKHFKAHGGCS